MRYDPVAYGVTGSKAFAGLIFWAVLMVGLLIYGGTKPVPVVASSDPGPGFGERYRHSRVASCATFDNAGFDARASDAGTDRDRS